MSLKERPLVAGANAETLPGVLTRFAAASLHGCASSEKCKWPKVKFD